MVPKHELLKNIPVHIQKLNYGKNIYELKEHVREEALSLNLSPKLGFQKKILLQVFAIVY